MRSTVPRHTERLTIWRPSATLFLLLELGRLSEQDLDACVQLLAFAAREGVVIDRPRLRDAIDALPTPDGQRLLARRSELRRRLEP